MNQSPNENVYQRARKSRDARFDGLFFVAVKTTGIYCRPICPANTPLEKNVEYHQSAVSAAHAGFRPCLRCRPDSAPQSCAWMGSQTSFQRALNLINAGALRNGSMQALANRLGISDRYLRDLFQQNLGTSPKKYAIYQQCLFAKQLLHESALPITEIAFAAGFNSVRRFNEAMQQQIGLAPRDIRKSDKSVANKLQLKLHYRPPFAWHHTLQFLQKRLIPGIEWVADEAYFRTVRYGDTKGYFSIENDPVKHCLLLTLTLDDYQHLNPITQRSRALFDVDAPIAQIDSQLSQVLSSKLEYLPGLRIPGIWDSYEAGIRAVLGQQVSVAQAMNLVTTLVQELGEDIILDSGLVKKLFPSPEVVSRHSLDFFRMPQSRKDTVRRLSDYFLSAQDPDNIDDWLAIKGIGPWTVNYVKIRAAKDPDVWLAGDAGINNALKILDQPLDLDAATPWRSYLTFQLWNQL
jgi:AraC family transcriptional regulator of adaptative response / DNA-3-methyladenine glycosylase II